MSTCFADEHTETPPKSIQFDSCSRFLNNELNSFGFCVILSPGNLTRDTRIHMREQAIFFAYFWQMLCKELYPVDEWMICRFINARHFIESQRHTWANYFYLSGHCAAQNATHSRLCYPTKKGDNKLTVNQKTKTVRDVYIQTGLRVHCTWVKNKRNWKNFSDSFLKGHFYVVF